ncbi:hypothetical protein [Deinococcus marmoris]|uniref:hypothetical protein n=1 Tax=Deinococcus marmoris TaxID=249408 RepID=UPI0009F8ACBD
MQVVNLRSPRLPEGVVQVQGQGSLTDPSWAAQGEQPHAGMQHLQQLVQVVLAAVQRDERTPRW